MITREQADSLAAECIKECTALVKSDVTILYSETVELKIGWVYFYQSTKYLETDAVRDMLLGNGPVLIMRSEGSVERLNTYEPIEVQLTRLRRYHRAIIILSSLRRLSEKMSRRIKRIFHTSKRK